MEHYYPDQFSRQFGFHQDVPADMVFDNLPDAKKMLHCHYVLTRYETGSQVLFPKQCNLLDKNTTLHMPVTPRGNEVIYLARTFRRMKANLKPKLKIVRSRKPLDLFIPLMEDSSSHVKILGIDVAISTTSAPTIPIQSIALLPQITNDVKEHFKSSLAKIQHNIPIGVCEPSTKNVTELRPEGTENIMDILDGESDGMNFKEELAHIPLPSKSQCVSSIGRIPSFGNDLFDSGSRIDGSKGVCSLDDDEVESICRANDPLRAPQEVDKNAALVFGKAILQKVSCTSFDGLPSLKGNFDSLYATILERGVDVTPLESKDERLIKQACDFENLQESYSGRTSAEEHLSCRIKVQGKLDEASRQLNTKGAHYEAKMAELKHEELLKELQLLENQKKDVSSQGQIDVFNAAEVMDVATKVSLEKDEAYINESLEDSKNFRWNP
ncbi:LOW QUALITY PROTEIN: hypothetical protein Cgig2_030718 [Carnegiea gigantea]|uniref:Uncharacterized protein n=1 Tax=Carnegiea gigantea TaxID=171969 RepID=A0A9Q1K5K9_9CARY|nr:LOW QUALITY PROTEIN: hypothetical protein Cgig2_030718 [Carnegiea gigantea]